MFYGWVVKLDLLNRKSWQFKTMNGSGFSCYICPRNVKDISNLKWSKLFENLINLEKVLLVRKYATMPFLKENNFPK